jgi:hypothetical protein
MTAISIGRGGQDIFSGSVDDAVAAQTSAPVRVALMGPELAGSGEAALGQAEAELSGREGGEAWTARQSAGCCASRT